jgi:hypothetical protein
VDDDFVREVDDFRLTEPAQNATLHDSDERTLVPEVGGDGDDAGRLGY